MTPVLSGQIADEEQTGDRSCMEETFLSTRLRPLALKGERQSRVVTYMRLQSCNVNWRIWARYRISYQNEPDTSTKRGPTTAESKSGALRDVTASVWDAL